MELTQRQECYQAIEDYRKRPLIVYATSTRTNVPASMAGDAIREFIEQIDAIPNGTSVDVLIHSTGGDALTAWKLMSLLRERFQQVGVLVPYMAFSAATLFALGADEIIMHPHASLGPIDPQLRVPGAEGKQRQFAYEDVGAFLRFLEADAKITEQTHVSTVIDKLFNCVDPVTVGFAKRASELSFSVGERLLLTHMTADDEGPKAKQIAEELNKSFFAHGDAVSRTRAKHLKLKVAESNPTLEALMWKAFVGFEEYMQFRKPFNLQEIFLADQAAAASVRPLSPLNLPPDTPPQAVQQAWGAVVNQRIQAAATAGVEIPFTVINAIIESTRVASEYRSVGRANGFRSAKGSIELSGYDVQSGWRNIPQDARTVIEGA